MGFRMTDIEKEPLNLPNFLFEYQNRKNDRDDLYMTLYSEEYGIWLEADVLLHAFLRDYPESRPQFFPFKLKWRECDPYNYRAPSHDSITVKIGNDPTVYEYEQFN